MTSNSPLDIGLAEVRLLAEKAAGRLDPHSSLQDAYTHVGLPHRGSYQRSAVEEVFCARIRAAFPSGHKAIRRHVISLMDQLVFDHYAADAPLEPAYSQLEAVRDAIHTGETGPAAGDLPAALESAADYQRYRGRRESSFYPHSHRATVAHAQLVRRLAKHFALRAADLDALKHRQAAVVEKLAQHMGGIELAKRLFRSISHKWDREQQRYHDVLVVPQITEPAQPRLPTMHLLNLAAKHPYPKKPIRRSDDDWSRLARESKDFAALFKVQPATLLDTIFIDPGSLLTQLTKKALEDSLFRMHQQRPSDVRWLMSSIVDACQARGYLPDEQRDALHALISVVDSLLRKVAGTLGPITFTSTELAQQMPRASHAQVEAILRERLAHPHGTANKRYVRPDQIPDDATPRLERPGANLAERPLIPLASAAYLLLDAAFCAPAFVEALLQQLREIGVTESQIGYAFEDMVGVLLQQHGVQTFSGTYEHEGKRMECDLVFETSDHVFFLETKKKPLTRKSRAGMTLGLLLDIGQSLVHAVLQGVRHEHKLRTDGHLSLRARDGSFRTVELRGRSVEVVALTLQEFGGFHDRIFLDRALAAQASMQFEVEQSPLPAKVKELNDQLKDLAVVVNELLELRPGPRAVRLPSGERVGGQMPFMNCWFLSLPHLLVVLDGVKTADELTRPHE